MKSTASSVVPPAAELKAILGTTLPIWQKLLDEMAAKFTFLREEWKIAKIPFGRVCLLKQKERTLLYLLPGEKKFDVSIVLGERAVALVLASDVPKEVKALISGARKYVEGRGIRMTITHPEQIEVVCELVVFKTTPK